MPHDGAHGEEAAINGGWRTRNHKPASDLRAVGRGGVVSRHGGIEGHDGAVRVHGAQPTRVRAPSLAAIRGMRVVSV